jgi:hypothetical protein
MKPFYQFLGIITIGAVLALTLLVAGCEMSGEFYDQDTLADKLESLTPNTAQDPYTIVFITSIVPIVDINRNK